MTTAVEPTKTKKPPKLFSVTGDSSGIKTVLSNYSRDKITDAMRVLYALAKADNTFPKALALSAALDAFATDPTAKDAKP